MTTKIMCVIRNSMNTELDLLILEIEKTETKLSSFRKKVFELKSFIEVDKEFSDSNFNNDDLNEIQHRIEEKDKLIEDTESFFKIGRWSFDFNNLEWSAETYRIFEYPENYKGTLREFYVSCVDEKTAARLKEQGRLKRQSRENSVRNQVIITPLGNKKLLTFTTNPILDKSGEIIGIEGLVKDITNRITGKNGLDNFFNLSCDLHCIASFDRYFLKVSPSWVKLLGYTEEELLSKSYMEFIHPDDVHKTYEKIEVFDGITSVYQFENRYITKSGETVLISWNSQLDPETQLLYCTARDITKSQMAQDQLLSDLSSKDLLLREIHHRVKNNLQIISSLLSLQSGANSVEERLVKLYQDSQNRIKSMAAIHEMFYQSEQLDKIEFGKYMEKLIGDLINTFASEEYTIDFTVDAETVYVNLDNAIPLGLIINEVVTNSIKHGGDAAGNVRIFVKMKTFLDDKLQLTIGDTGVNGIKNVLDSSDETLGVLLINSLVDQIDGKIEQINNCGGTTFQLIFSDKLNIKS